jgi:hypothetical protein
MNATSVNKDATSAITNVTIMMPPKPEQFDLVAPKQP